MYNEDVKERFIADYTKSFKTAYYVRTVFNKFEPYENEWKEDLSLQPTEVIEPIVNTQKGTRMQSAERTLIVLREYVKWRKRNGLRAGDGIFEVKVDTIEAIRTQMFANPKDLQEKLDRVFTAEDKETVDCLYRAYIWMLYAGLKNTEALEVVKDEVDLTNMVINHNKEVYRIYEEAKTAFEQACTLKDFVYIHYGEPSYEVRKDRAPGDRIIRGLTDGIKLSTIKAALTKKPLNPTGKDANGSNGLPPVKLMYKKIYYSGVFYRTYLDEINGMNVDFGAQVAREIADAEYDDVCAMNRMVRHKMRELELDYEKWKCVFAV